MVSSRATPAGSHSMGYAMGASRRDQDAALNTQKSRGAALGNLGRIAQRLQPRGIAAMPKPYTGVIQGTTPGRRKG